MRWAPPPAGSCATSATASSSPPATATPSPAPCARSTTTPTCAHGWAPTPPATWRRTPTPPGPRASPRPCLARPARSCLASLEEATRQGDATAPARCHRVMRRLLTALLILCLAVPATAGAEGGVSKLLRDACSDEHIDGTYTQAEYKKALDQLPTDSDEYTGCREVLQRGRLAALGAGKHHSTNTGGGGGTTGGGTAGGSSSSG